MMSPAYQTIILAPKGQIIELYVLQLDMNDAFILKP